MRRDQSFGNPFYSRGHRKESSEWDTAGEYGGVMVGRMIRYRHLVPEPRHRLNWKGISAPDAWVNTQGLIKVADPRSFQPIKKALEKCKVFALPKHL